MLFMLNIDNVSPMESIPQNQLVKICVIVCCMYMQLVPCLADVVNHPEPDSSCLVMPPFSR